MVLPIPKSMKKNDRFGGIGGTANICKNRYEHGLGKSKGIGVSGNTKEGKKL